MSSQSVKMFIELDRLRGLVEPLGWEIAAQDFRGDPVLITLQRPKSSFQVADIAPGEVRISSPMS